MKHASFFIGLALVSLGSLLGTACNKPTEESCKAALSNIQHLLGTDSLTSSADQSPAIRRCRGASKRDAVQCAIDAKNLDQLQQCSFFRDVAGQVGGGSGSGSN